MEAGLITRSQVDIALKQQQIIGRRLGEIMVTRGWLDQQTIDKIMVEVILPESNIMLR